MSTKNVARVAATAALLGMSLLAPLTASAATAVEDPGAKALYRVYTNNDDGHTSFESDGEHLFACDDWADGDTIRAEMESDGGTWTVTDGNGAGGGCGEYPDDIEIPEGQDVNIRVCHVEDGYCSGWKDAEA